MWNVLIEKIKILVVKDISPLKFARYLSYSEIPKNRNDVITGTDFSKLEFILNMLQNRSMGSFW